MAAATPAPRPATDMCHAEAEPVCRVRRVGVFPWTGSWQCCAVPVPGGWGLAWLGRGRSPQPPGTCSPSRRAGVGRLLSLAAGIALRSRVFISWVLVPPAPPLQYLTQKKKKFLSLVSLSPDLNHDCVSEALEIPRGAALPSDNQNLSDWEADPTGPAPAILGLGSRVVCSRIKGLGESGSS